MNKNQTRNQNYLQSKFCLLLNQTEKLAGIGSWQLNLDTQEFFCSNGVYEMLGFEPNEFPMDLHKLRQFMHPDDQSDAYIEMNSAIENGIKFCSQKRLVHQNGSLINIESIGQLVTGEQGEADQLIGVFKKVSEQLNQHSNELQASNRELEQFAFVVSHDLQEPLRMITGFLSQLEKKYSHLLDEKGQNYIHFAVDGATRMKKIIRDLLEFSRVGRYFEDQKNIDLNELIKEIELLYQKTIFEKGAIIEFQNLPKIHYFKAPVFQVFQNLISNALKYSLPDRQVRIKISATDMEDHWQFSVEDNGIGIAKEDFEKIFVVFRRLHTKDEYSGTGMGLAIVRKIIDNANGKIWVESKKGKGSSFIFTLPKLVNVPVTDLIR